MISDSLQEKVTRLETQCQNIQNELRQLRSVYTKYPDLTVVRNPLSKEDYYVSPSVNEIADCVRITQVNGIFEIFPYKLVLDIPVHTSPPLFSISRPILGELCADFQGNVYYDLDEMLIDNKISPVVIEIIKTSLNKIVGACTHGQRAHITNNSEENE